MRKDWKDAESKAAADFGKKQPGSGAGIEKLDVSGQGVYSDYLIEVKSTDKDSISISVKSIKEQEMKALSMGRKSFRLIKFNNHPNLGEYVLIRKKYFQSRFDNETD